MHIVGLCFITLVDSFFSLKLTVYGDMKNNKNHTFVCLLHQCNCGYVTLAVEAHNAITMRHNIISTLDVWGPAATCSSRQKKKNKNFKKSVQEETDSLTATTVISSTTKCGIKIQILTKMSFYIMLLGKLRLKNGKTSALMWNI